MCVCFRVVDSSSANNKLCIITTFDFGRAGSISDRVLHCVSVLTPSVQAPLDPIAMKHVWTQAYKHRFGLMAVWSYIKGITTITITAFHPLQQFPFLPPRHTSSHILITHSDTFHPCPIARSIRQECVFSFPV